MLQVRHTHMAVISGIRKVGFLVCLCLFMQQAQAQVWRLDTADPEITNGVPVTLDLELLALLNVGDEFNVLVDSTQTYRIRIDDIGVLSNGDRRWHGSIVDTGLDYSLVITAGKRTAHLILTSPSGIFQLYGQSEEGVYFKGRFNRLEHVRDEVATTETILPSAGSLTSNLDTVTTEPFYIRQSLSQPVVEIGGKVTVDLTFNNIGETPLLEQYADIFFVLENTTLEQLPADCEILQSTENEPVLSCYLGDIAARETKQLSFTVQTSEASYPLVYNTVLVDETRSDAIIEVYRDVTTDSDNDGISDFNEALIGTDQFAVTADQTAYIDVLVAHTPELNEFYLGEVDTRINQLFNMANKILADSEAGIVLRPVGIHEVEYEPAEALLTDLTRLTFQDDPAFADLSRKRQLYGGDLVVLFKSGEEDGLCGLANLGGKGTQGDLSADYQKGFAYSVINIDCKDDSVLAHEIGHNLGLVHSRLEDESGGTLSSSAGFGVDDRFVTVMAFPDDYHVVNRLYRFSDPFRACGPFLCGEDSENTLEGADAVSTLKLVKHQVAAYYPSQESRIPVRKTASTFDGPVSAMVGIGAYNATDTTFRTSFSISETINLRMKIAPLPGQLGKKYITHLVVVSGKSNLYQMDITGSLVPWNGNLKNLEPASATRYMTDRELFDIAVDLDLASAGLRGKPVNVFVAYRMVETGELVYGLSPFSLSTSTPESF